MNVKSIEFDFEPSPGLAELSFSFGKNAHRRGASRRFYVKADRKGTHRPPLFHDYRNKEATGLIFVFESCFDALQFFNTCLRALAIHKDVLSRVLKYVELGVEDREDRKGNVSCRTMNVGFDQGSCFFHLVSHSGLECCINMEVDMMRSVLRQVIYMIEPEPLIVSDENGGQLLFPEGEKVSES